MGDVERRLEDLAKALGGGWRVEQGVTPVVVLTLPEAEALSARLAAGRGPDDPPPTGAER